MNGDQNIEAGQNIGAGSGIASGSMRVTGSVALPAIERLKGRENYTSWAFAMKMILIREGSWCAVRPAEGQVIDDDLKMRALATICLSLETTNYSLVQDAKDAQEAWQKLQNAFEDNGLTRKIGLLRKLTSIRLETCMSVEAYVDELMSTSHKLAGIGFKVDDSWLAALLLMGLPNHYEPMIMGLEASGTALTSDAVKAKILQDVKLQDSVRDISKEEAFYTGQKLKPQKKINFRKKNIFCYNCKKPGHIASKCPEKQCKIKNDKSNALCSIFQTGNVKAEEWYLDSGATCHMTRSNDGFEKAQNLTQTVETANNSTILSVATGLVNLECKEGLVHVEEVLHVPDLATNLLSVSKMCQKGHKVIFSADRCEVRKANGELIVTAKQEDGLYRLNRISEKSFLSVNIETWHRRLGHLNFKSLIKLKKIADGIDFKDESILDCMACIQGKHAREPFSTSGSRAKEILDLVHSDLCGPIEVPSLGRNRYFMTFIDDASRKVFVYFLKAKNQAQKTYETFKTMTERQTGKKLKVLRTDNGKEFVNTYMKNSFERDGVLHQKTCSYTPEQNGVAERMNRTIVEKARSMLNDAGLPKHFWAEAVSTAVYLINRSPAKALNNKTPEEIWFNKKPNLQHLKIFGSSALVQIPKQKRKKFDRKSRECIFVGYAENTKGYRLYDTRTRDIIVSRDVIIVAEGQKLKLLNEQPKLEFMELYNTVSDSSTESLQKLSDVQLVAESTNVEGETVIAPQSTEVVQDLRRSCRQRRYPGKYTNFVSLNSCTGKDLLLQPNLSEAYSEVYNLEDPTSYSDVLKRPDRDLWLEAMREEIAALNRNETWVLTDLPEGRKAISNKWVFKTKRGSDGQIERYKARLVVKGCSQRPGIDYDEVYSPVVRYSTVRYLMALAVKYNLDIDHMDAITAFLQGKLKDEIIYMSQPEGFILDTTKVCKLQKALYGLKQSSRVWNLQLDSALRNYGLVRSKVDTCLYFKISGDKMLFVTIYVDDFLIFTNDNIMKLNLKKFLNNRFMMKDLGEAKFCLGLRITRDRKIGLLWLDQRNYLENILARFNMTNCHPVSTPADASLKLDKSLAPRNDDEIRVMQTVPYKEAVGCLMYAAQVSRPDINFAVNMVSQYSSNPGRQHWEAVKRIMRYIKGTLNKRLQYSKNENSQIIGYTDADWGGELDTRKSTTGYVFNFMGGAISWNVKKQPTVALSSCEAEYMALSRTIQEALWWSHLQMQIFDAKSIPVLCDNQSAICIAKNDSYNPRTKHVDIRYHFVRDTLDKGLIELQYVNTKNQAADGFTKSLDKQKHQFYLNMIAIVD